MNKFLPFILFYISMASCGFTPNTSKRFRSEAGKFEVDFPSAPKSGSAIMIHDNGQLTIHSFLAKPENDDNLSYEVRYIDLPDNVLAEFKGEFVYDLFLSMAKGPKEGPPFEIMGTLNLNKNGYVGREYRSQYLRSKDFSRMQFYMVGNRMYQLIVETAVSNNFNISINQFFDSFELIGTASDSNGLIASETYDRNDFDIEFPFSTEKREMETLTEYGNVKIFAEIAQHSVAHKENLAYMVMVMKYPEDITKTENFDLEEHYSELVQNGLNNRQSVLISKKEIILDGVRGIASKESFKNGQIIINQQSFLLGDTQIVVSVMTIPKNDDNLEQKEFFWSLSLK